MPTAGATRCDPRRHPGGMTVPLHALVLRQAPPATRRAGARRTAVAAREVLRSRPFWLLSGAFFLATLAGIAMLVHAIPFLLERGYGPASRRSPSGCRDLPDPRPRPVRPARRPAARGVGDRARVRADRGRDRVVVGVTRTVAVVAAW